MYDWKKGLWKAVKTALVGGLAVFLATNGPDLLGEWVKNSLPWLAPTVFALISLARNYFKVTDKS